MNAIERRKAIIEHLCEVRQSTLNNLAFEFNVTKRTIQNDVLELSLSHPIYTQSGRHGGGVYVAEDYYLGKQFLSKEQKDVLESLIGKVEGSQKKVLESIIAKFGRPSKGGIRKWKQ